VKPIDLNNLFQKRKIDFDKNELFDVAVIGGGVVGCAVFREFCINGAKTVLIEKENDILEGASKGNSALLHTGFDAPVDTLEHQCVQRGYAEYLKIKDRLNLPILKTSALVVAWNDEQLAKFDAILQKGFTNGVKELETIDRDTLLKREPNLSKDAKGAIWVKGESVIDAWSAPLAYMKEGVANGGKLAFSCKVENGEFDGERWKLKTSRVDIKAKIVINAAGLYGDEVENIHQKDSFKIIPRKGQFLVYDKSAYDLVNAIILPVPTKRTKGVVITKTAFGNLLVGPTAEDQESKTDSSTVEETLRGLQEKAIKMVPKLKHHDITATFAGLRPASDETYYRVNIDKEKNWITLGGIRSTGLTASLGIAKYIFEELGEKYEKKEHIDISVPNISQFAKRDFENEGYGKIICHCELVTDREIKNALKGECGAGTLGGLKRRTRAAMGRCQGFNCLPNIAELCEKESKI
jgi:glycerol-3-phosphate dehydrogenase